MKIKLQKITSVLFGFSLVTIFVLCFFVSFANAADQGTLGAYPTNFDPTNPKTKSWFIYELKPGETKEDSITVVNNTERTLEVKVYPVDATTTGDGAFALLNEDQRQNDVGAWVNISRENITIGARDRKDIPFTIAVPKYTTVGDHAGGIIVQEVKKPTVAKEGMGLNIVSRVGTRIYETVPGAKVVSLDVTNFKHKIVDNQLVFTFTMENKGNVILTPTGTLDVKDNSGKVLETITLSSLGSVFPKKPTEITAKSKLKLPYFAQYKATVTINYSPTKAVSRSIEFPVYFHIQESGLFIPVVGIILFIILMIILRKIFGHLHRVRQLKRRSEAIEDEDDSPVVTPHVRPTKPAYAQVPAVENIDQIFIAHHIKLLIILFLVGLIVLSTLFAFILQQFVLSNNIKQADAVTKDSQTALQPTAPPIKPTPTNVPVKKSEMEVIVLNGSGIAGAAKKVAVKLIAAGFKVINSDNAEKESAITVINYPVGKEDGADLLIQELKPDYPTTRKIASESATFTVILGQ